MKICGRCPGNHSLSESPLAQAHLQRQYGLVDSTASLAAAVRNTAFAQQSMFAKVGVLQSKGYVYRCRGSAPTCTSHLTSGRRWNNDFWLTRRRRCNPLNNDRARTMAQCAPLTPNCDLLLATAPASSSSTASVSSQLMHASVILTPYLRPSLPSAGTL